MLAEPARCDTNTLRNIYVKYLTSNTISDPVKKLISIMNIRFKGHTFHPNICKRKINRKEKEKMYKLIFIQICISWMAVYYF